MLMCVDLKTLYSTLGTTWIPRQLRWTYVVSRYAYVIALDNPKHKKVDVPTVYLCIIYASHPSKHVQLCQTPTLDSLTALSSIKHRTGSLAHLT